MAHRKPLSVKHKMAGIIFLVSMFVLILTSAQFAFFESKHKHDFTAGDLNSLARAISLGAALPMANEDHAQMQEILGTLRTREDVVSAQLLDTSGRSLASYPVAPAGASAIDSTRLVELIATENRLIAEGCQQEAEKIWVENGQMSLFMPVVYECNIVGYNLLSLEMEGPHHDRWQLALSWLLSMLMVIVLTYLLSAKIQRYITEPIEQLASQMLRISKEKRLTGLIHHENKDEFEVLFTGFEEMIKSLKERDHLLAQQRRNLELEVQVRTRAMEAEKERAEQATLAKSRFLANMSHEIRTPLIGVLGMAELLRKGSLESHQKEMVDVIHNSGTALLKILNDILDFSKIEAKQLKFEEIPLDLKQLTAETVQMMMVRAKAKGLAFKVEMPDVLPLVIGDPGRIRQILLNLVDNAVKFTDSGTVSIILRSSCDGTTNICNCIFDIQDTGIGVDQDIQDRIFNSFDQGDGSTTRKYGGTGLGLAIVKNLVQTMGGDVSLESTPGHGSTFSVSLPLVAMDQPDSTHDLPEDQTKPDETTAADMEPAPPSEMGKGMHILLAEDNPTTQSLVSILLEQMGFDLTIVDNGQSAVEFLEKEEVDLILMDCQMPQLDGFKATARLRAKGIDTPVIALTAYARDEDEEHCLAVGMNDFLSKPFRHFEMRAMLEKWLVKDTRRGFPRGENSAD